jgi:hypothetical protein
LARNKATFSNNKATESFNSRHFNPYVSVTEREAPWNRAQVGTHLGLGGFGNRRASNGSKGQERRNSRGGIKEKHIKEEEKNRKVRRRQ